MSSQYTVGVISDTHGRLPIAATVALQGADHIIHAGDIVGQEVLDELELIAPVTAVLGNCDIYDGRSYKTTQGSVKYSALVELGSKQKLRVFVIHKPEDAQAALSGQIVGGSVPFGSGAPLPQVCIYGHTHAPRNEYGKAGILMLNPGSPTLPRASVSSVALFTINNGSVENCQIVSI